MYQENEVFETVSLLTFLKQTMGLTRKEISRLKFLPDGICVNGQKAIVTQTVIPGDRVSISISQLQERREEKNSDGSIPILYEDDTLFVAEKPAGLVCHPSHGHFDSSLFDLALQSLNGSRPSCAQCIGRLDKDTSGLVLFAKDRMTAARLSDQRKKGLLSKTYYALVHGTFSPEERAGRIAFPIGKDPDSRERWKIGGVDSRPALTHYEVLCQDAAFSLVSCHLETGRTHQIRIHMAALGHPLFGDPLYGYGQTGLTRACLHCGSLTFQHPYRKEEICITSFPGQMFTQITTYR